MLAALLTILLSASSVTLDLPHGLPHLAFALLGLCGAVSVLPLWLFAYAASRLPLSVMGFFQFVLPTTQFIVALIFYRQHVSVNTAVCFSIISAALLVIATEPLLRRYVASLQSEGASNEAL